MTKEMNMPNCIKVIFWRFLNISVRALESKRYRISKKINLNTKKTSLLEHLKETFKDTKIDSII